MEHKGEGDGSGPSDYSFCTPPYQQTPELVQLSGKRKSNQLRKSAKRLKSSYPKLDTNFIKVASSANKKPFPDVGTMDEKKFSFCSNTVRKIDSLDSSDKIVESAVKNNNYSEVSYFDFHKVDLLNSNKAKSRNRKTLFPCTSYDVDKTENSTSVRTCNPLYYKSNVKSVATRTLESKKHLDKNDHIRKPSLDFTLSSDNLKATKCKNKLKTTNEGSRQMELEQSVLEATPPSVKSRKIRSMKKHIFQELKTDQLNDKVPRDEHMLKNNLTKWETTPTKICSSSSTLDCTVSHRTKYCAKTRHISKKRLAIIAEDDAVIPPTPPKQKKSKDLKNICAQWKDVSLFQGRQNAEQEIRTRRKKKVDKNSILLNNKSNICKGDSPVIKNVEEYNDNIQTSQSVTFESRLIEDVSSSESEIGGQYVIETEETPEKPNLHLEKFQIENSQESLSACSFKHKHNTIEDFSSPESENKYLYNIEVERTPERPVFNTKDFQIENSPKVEVLLNQKKNNPYIDHKIEDLSSQESENKYLYTIETENTPEKPVFNMKNYQIESSQNLEEVLLHPEELNGFNHQKIEDLSSPESENTYLYNIEMAHTPERPVFGMKDFQIESSPKVEVLLTSNKINSHKDQKIEELSSQESENNYSYNIESEETPERPVYIGKNFLIESSPKQVMLNLKKINSSTYHKIEDLSSPESVMNNLYTIETEETPERSSFNLNYPKIENSPYPREKILNKNKLEISYTFEDDDQMIDDPSSPGSKTEQRYVIETEESPTKSINMKDFEIEDSQTPDEALLSGSFMPASQVIDMLPDYFMKNMKIESSHSLSQFKHPKEKEERKIQHKSDPVVISSSQRSVINPKRNLFAKEKSDLNIIQTEDEAIPKKLQPPEVGSSHDKIDNENHIVENKYTPNFKKKPKSGLLLKKAYKVASKIRKSHNLFTHEVKSGLRSLSDKQTSLLELISSHSDDNVYYLVCKPVHNTFDSLKVKKVIIVANDISTKTLNMKYVIVHFPVTVLWSPALNYVLALVGNKINLVENVNFDKRVNRISSINVNNFAINNLGKKMVRTLQSNGNNSVFDLAIGQLLMPELALNLIVIHLFYIEQDSYILGLDAEEQFCLLCFSGQDSEKIKSKKSLYDGSTIVTKGFCFIGASVDNMIRSLLEFATGREVKTDQFFILAPAVENWEVKSTTRPLVKWKSTTQIETVVKENNPEKRYKIIVPSVIYNEGEFFICDNSYGTKYRVKHLKKEEPFVQTNVRVLDGVFYRNGTFLVDQFTKVIYL
ncbi:uncharacterized protein LOC106666652 [Cimex lectularius]|uniref:Uncharacterized protein n=1 Tax=Cimex lectularius TaxID=79782 RepID=A0A8I6RQV8_CIMLE|nr:uncharacterized protein LOC106666652 [Cimex lectularius]